MIDRHPTRVFVAALAAALLAAPVAANQLDPAEEIDIELKRAPLTETLLSFAAVSGARLDMAEGVAGEVTIAARSRPWTRVLDDVCREHALTCETFGGDAPVLRVRPAGDGPAGFGQAISLELVDAPVRAVLTSFEEFSGLTFQVADDVRGTVSFSFRKVPWPRALEETCALAGCRVVWGGETVGIERMAGDEPPLLDMSLKSADVGEVLRAFASFPIFGSTATRVEIDPAVQGTVTVELRYVSWAQALDLTCEQAGCGWVLEYGDPSVLRVFPAGGRPRSAALVREPGAEARTLAYRFEPPGGAPLAGVAAFTWAEPIHVRASDGPYRLRLSWLPLGAGRSVVLPLIERCEPAQSSVVVLEPVALPLAFEEVRHEAEGAALTLEPAPADAPASPPPAKAAAACGPARRGEIRVTVRHHGERAGDGPRAERRFKLASHLLVTPVATREPVAAVVALGVGLDGRQGLALLRPTEEEPGVAVETLALGRGDKVERVVWAGGRPFELAIAFVDERPSKE